MKVCSKCKVEKDESEFGKDENGANLLKSYCRICKRTYDAAYRKQHKSACNQRSLNYYQENKARCQIKQTQYRNSRYHHDPLFKLQCSLRSRTRHAFAGVQKSAVTLNLLGCTLEFFKEYLESKFQPGMTWDNYGKNGWHLDHIKPCAAFDLSDPEQQRQCSHWSNQQPLWAADNIRKSDKWEAPCNSVTPMV